jgi:hypothetical protein
LLLLVLPRAEQFTGEAQGFVLEFCVLRSLGNGALERVDQLGDGREDRAVVVGQFGISSVCQPTFDGFSGIGYVPYLT